MIKTFGVLAHVDAGKTTLSEQLLFLSGAIRAAGRVDSGNTVLDFGKIEKERGITVFSAQARFENNGDTYFLVDTPGHADFGAETERCLRILDFAIIVVSAVEGVQATTETLWRLTAEYKIPVFFFINKTDRVGADTKRVLSEISERLTDRAVMLGGGFDSFSRERIAELDETLLDAYICGNTDDKLWYDKSAKLTEKRELFPCFCGSALNGTGIAELLNGMNHLTKTEYDETAPFSAVAYKIMHDKSLQRLTFLKVLSGVLHTKDILNGEKVDEIRVYTGEKYTSAQSVSAGGLCCVTGLRSSFPSSGFGAYAEKPVRYAEPPMFGGITAENTTESELMRCLKILEDEDNTLCVTHSARTGITVRFSGKMRLEILVEQLSERFGITATAGEAGILYKETVSEKTVGYGHYEPLRHYAEVVLSIEPSEKNGIEYFDAVPNDMLDINFRNLIRTHIFEKEHIGTLTGSPLTNVRITLLAAKTHLKHTEGGDLREATYRAVRNALRRTAPVLLEPIYEFTADFPNELTGRILGDLHRLRAVTEPPYTYSDRTRVSGKAPVSLLSAYAIDLPSVTGGRGIISLRPDGYEPCHNTDEVVEKYAYSADADGENPCGSIFCAKGAGYYVAWDEVDRLVDFT